MTRPLALLALLAAPLVLGACAPEAPAAEAAPAPTSPATPAPRPSGSAGIEFSVLGGTGPSPYLGGGSGSSGPDHRPPPTSTPAPAGLWATLATVRIDPEDYTLAGPLPPEVAALHGETLTVRGYMIPLDQQGAQTHFLLTYVPLADCFYCLPGGPEAFIEVRAARPVPFQTAPVTLEGRFETLEGGMLLFRLADARPA